MNNTAIFDNFSKSLDPLLPTILARSKIELNMPAPKNTGGAKGKRAKAATSTVAASNFSKDVFGLEFDGASKGNPGKAGAGALIRGPDGSVLCELSKGVGIATCNFAEYCALLIGLQAAADQGICHIRAQGDSKLVCKQVTGDWKVKSQNLTTLYADVMKLKKKFESFSIHHVYRDLNTDADVLANSASELPANKLVSFFRTRPVRETSKSTELDGVHSANGTLEYIPSSNDKGVFVLEYHGASKGNPGKAGAGVVILNPDGVVHLQLRERLSTTTRNAAHYHALLIGLRMALQHGVTRISVQGDSDLVFNQMTGKKKVRDENLQVLSKEANNLLEKFAMFSIGKKWKNENGAARALAAAAIHLPDTYTSGLDTLTRDLGSVALQNSAQGRGISNLRFGGDKQSIKLPSAGSRPVTCQHYQGQTFPWPLYNNQSFRVCRAQFPQARSRAFSIAMPRCTHLPLMALNKSIPKIVDCLSYTKLRHLSSILQRANIPLALAITI